MIIQSRRAFVASLLASGAGVAGSAHAMRGGESAHNDVAQDASGSFALEEGWLFAFDASASMVPPAQTNSESKWMPVTVPHTWQAMAGNPGYAGVAWYRLEFTAPREWEERFVRVEFEAVTHTTHVFLNGKPAGQHVGKGYTAFTCDLSPLLEYGDRNVLFAGLDIRFFSFAHDGK
ncbi:MAG: sugar-binding domain-containing protein [Silvibacterium sp.]